MQEIEPNSDWLKSKKEGIDSYNRKDHGMTASGMAESRASNGQNSLFVGLFAFFCVGFILREILPSFT